MDQVKRGLIAVVGCGLLGLIIGVTISIALFRQTTMTNVLAGFAVTIGGVIIGAAVGWLATSKR